MKLTLLAIILCLSLQVLASHAQSIEGVVREKGTWTELPGFAYLNAEFIKKFDDAGKPVRIEKTEPITIDVRLADEAK